MSFPRRVEPEILDVLSPADPRAIRARRDLQRINAVMFQARIMTRLLDWCCESGPPPRVLVELGGGDATFIASIAGKLCRRWPDVTVISVDRQNPILDETRQRVRRCGWNLECVTADVFDYLHEPKQRRADIMLSNLFLHHLSDEDLRRLFSSVAKCTGAFAACEPWRASGVLASSKLLFAIGCNDVTRHDSVTSVRAGFRDSELSALFPRPDGWTLHERFALPFTHCFAARRSGASHV